VEHGAHFLILHYPPPSICSLMVRRWSTVPISLSYTTPPPRRRRRLRRTRRPWCSTPWRRRSCGRSSRRSGRAWSASPLTRRRRRRSSAARPAASRPCGSRRTRRRRRPPGCGLQPPTAAYSRYAEVANCGAFRAGDDGSRGRYATPADSPSTRWYPVPRATRTPLGFGLCASFKGHSLSRRAKP
jgi:hypothetical protein